MRNNEFLPLTKRLLRVLKNMRTLIQSPGNDQVIVDEMRDAGWSHIIRSYGCTPIIPDDRGMFGDETGFYATFALLANDGGIFAKSLSHRDANVLQNAIVDFEGVVASGNLFVQRSGRHTDTCINHEV